MADEKAGGVPDDGARPPRGELSIRTVCMPADTNSAGDIFGGWLLGQMDLAGAIFARKTSGGRTATVAVDAMVFCKPVHVGDVMCLYADLIRIGTTSVAVRVEAWVIRDNESERLLVTEGTFTYVALDDNRRPRKIERRTSGARSS